MANLEILPVLLEAPRVLRLYFPDDPLILRITSNPNESVEGETLVLGIQTRLDPDRAMALLDAFDDTQWLDQPPSILSMLSVTLDYI